MLRQLFAWQKVRKTEEPFQHLLFRGKFCALSLIGKDCLIVDHHLKDAIMAFNQLASDTIKTLQLSPPDRRRGHETLIPRNK